jgi:DNA-binding LacI/PurR family transcriptional regulator
LSEKPKSPSGRKVTSHDVARAANVSQSLVSRAFSGQGRIANETRERIFRAASEIGWQPNALAASMVTQNVPLVAVVTTRLNFDWRAQVLSRYLSSLHELRLKPLLFYAQNDADVGSLLREAASWRTRGVVVLAGDIDVGQADAILSQGQFLVALNRPTNHPEGFSVTTDNRLGGAMAGRVFRTESRRSCLVLGGSERSWASSLRIDGLVEALAGSDTTVTVWHHSDMSTRVGLQCAARYLQLGPDNRPDAVFATNDAMAMGFIDGLRGRGIQLGRDLSLIGFDNLSAAAWAPYRLTTFEQPLDEMMGKCLDYINGHLSGAGAPRPDGQTIRCKPNFIERSTTRPRGDGAAGAGATRGNAP